MISTEGTLELDTFSIGLLSEMETRVYLSLEKRTFIKNMKSITNSNDIGWAFYRTLIYAVIIINNRKVAYGPVQYSVDHPTKNRNKGRERKLRMCTKRLLQSEVEPQTGVTSIFLPLTDNHSTKIGPTSDNAPMATET